MSLKTTVKKSTRCKCVLAGTRKNEDTITRRHGGTIHLCEKNTGKSYGRWSGLFEFRITCPEPTALHAIVRKVSEWTKVHPYNMGRAYGSDVVQARNGFPSANGRCTTPAAWFVGLKPQ